MVAPWKKNEVEELSKRIKESKVVGVVGIEGIPSRQLQKMRRDLGGQVDVKVARSNIIRHALEKAKRDEALGDYIKGPSAIVLTDVSPFKLDRLISDNTATAPAKAGSVAPKDIVIPAGDTPFAPGPIIGDLQGVGIKAKIAGGKIVVLADSKVVSEGDEISAELASVLTRFGIEPLVIGFNLRAAAEEGLIYPGEVLHIDDKETNARFVSAYQSALNLSLNSGIMNSVTIPYFIRDSHMKAVNLAFNAKLYTKETIEFMVSQANWEAIALKSRLPEDVSPGKESQKVKEEPAAEKAGDEPKKEEAEPENKEESEAKPEADSSGGEKAAEDEKDPAEPPKEA